MSSSVPNVCVYGTHMHLLTVAVHNSTILHTAIAECAGWAENGECSLNPTYMLQNCPIACAGVAEKDKVMAEEIGTCNE